MGFEFPFYSKIVVLLKPCLNSINTTINLKCAVFQNSASRGRSGFEFSSKSLCGRTRRFIFYRWLGIRIKWTKVEQLILEEHLDEGKSAVEFRKWQESLEDPKPGNQQDEPVAPFRDLRERMEMIETGWSRLLLVPVGIVLDDKEVFVSWVRVPIQSTLSVSCKIDVSWGVGGDSISPFIRRCAQLLRPLLCTRGVVLD